MQDHKTLANVLLSSLSCWKCTEDDLTQAVEAAFAPDCYYHDVHCPAAIRSTEAMVHFLKEFRSRLPDITIAPHGKIETVGRHGRINFRLLRDGKVFSNGVFFVEFSEHGKVQQMIGFVD